MTPFYDDGQITVYCGDCRDVLPGLADGSVDLIITDPPYGVRQADWDHVKPDAVIWDACARVLCVGGALYYWGFWGCAPWILSNGARVGLTSQSRIVWWFRTGRPERAAYREDTEDAYYFTKGEPLVFNVAEDYEPYEDPSNYGRYQRPGKHPGTVWTASRVLHNHPDNWAHPTQKPLPLIERMVRISSEPGALVLDPFMGSGTALRAAKNLGRRAIGIEIDERYCQIAVERLRQGVLL